MGAAALCAVLGWACTPSGQYRADAAWYEGTPFTLLSILVSHPATGYPVRRAREEFVRVEHLPGLVNLLDSPTPCAAVLLPEGGEFPARYSTVGNEAAFLIEGYRAGRYPPRPSSLSPEPDREEIRAWWEARIEGASSAP